MDSDNEQRTRVRRIAHSRSSHANPAPGVLAAALAAVLVVAVVSIGVIEDWPMYGISAMLFMLALYAAVLVWRRVLPLHAAPVMLPLALTVVWGAAQCWTGATVYGYVTEMHTIELGASLCVFWVALEALASSKLRAHFRNGMIAFGAVI